MNKAALRVATYNIHRCVGTDGLYRPDRIVGVLKELDADIIGLQEIDSHSISEDGHQLNYIIKNTRYHVIAGPTMFKSDVHYGNALLTRHEIKTIQKIDLSVSGFEPRGALSVDMEIFGRLWKIVNVHLGLKLSERASQLNVLMKNITLDPGTPVVLMGDFNEWVPLKGATRMLGDFFRRKGWKGTFPSQLPVLRLDEVYVHPKNWLRRAKVHRSGLSRVASDHLPVVADVALV